MKAIEPRMTGIRDQPGNGSDGVWRVTVAGDRWRAVSALAGADA